MSLACWQHGVIWASGSGWVSVELLEPGLARFPGSGSAVRCPGGIRRTRVPELQSQNRTLSGTACRRGRSIERRGLRGQFSAQADPAVAVAADRELSQVDVAVVAVGEHLRGRLGDAGEAAEVDGGVLVVEVVQEQHGAGRVVG